MGGFIGCPVASILLHLSSSLPQQAAERLYAIDQASSPAGEVHRRSRAGFVNSFHNLPASYLLGRSHYIDVNCANPVAPFFCFSYL